MAPTSFDSYAPFDDGAGANVTELQWRSMIRLTVDSGTLTGNGVVRGAYDNLVVYADSSGAQVKVKAGEVWIHGTWGALYTEKTIPIAVGDATDPRIDAVICRADFADNVVEIDVLQGTPAAVPVAPSLTISATVYEIPLAEVNVPALDNNIAAGQVFDCRRYQDVPAPVIRSTADTTVNNSTTFVDVTGMSIALARTGAYLIDGHIEYEAATAADIKFQFVGPSGFIGRTALIGADSAAAGASASASFAITAVASTMTLGGAGVGTRMGAHLSGWIQTPSVQTLGDPLTNPMTVKLQFAQNTANASNATVAVNSWIRFYRLF